MSKEIDELKDTVVQVLKTCYDPEIPVDIWELGLIYQLRFDEDKKLTVIMTLTSPMCPVAETLPKDVESKLRTVEGITDVKVEITWSPPWNKDMMSEVAQVELGFL